MVAPGDDFTGDLRLPQSTLVAGRESEIHEKDF